MLKKMSIFVLAFVSFFSIESNLVNAQEVKTKQDMIAFVKKAAAFAEKEDKDNAIKEFNNKSGQFFMDNGATYIFAYNLEGVNLALPNNPEKIGKNLSELVDKEGTPMVKKFIEIAKSKPGNKGEAEMDWWWPNAAAGNKVQKKSGYIIGMGDWVLGSGVYESK